jgi:hypothetical protein
MTDEALDQALAAISNTVPAPIDSSGSGGGNRSAFTDFDNQLIADLVANIRRPADILVQYGLTASDIAAKARNPEWAARYRQMKAAWNSDTNIRDRIRAKAAYLLEDSLVPLFKIISGGGSHTAKLEAIEKLIKISTVSHIPKDEATQTERSRIQIFIAGRESPVTVISETPNDRAITHVPADTAINAK